jgi:uncharacterized protein (DUF2141 family)
MITERPILPCVSHDRRNRGNRLHPLPHGLAAALVLVFCLATNSVLADSAEGDLVIQVSGFADASGQAMAYLFHKGDNVLEKPETNVSASIVNGFATLTFPKLTYGTYAVTVYHDKNGNSMIDHNMLHMPAEPMGFSNGFRLGLFSGFPSFEKLQFDFSSDTKPLAIVVK